MDCNYGLRADLSQTTYRTRGVAAFTSGATFTGYAGWFNASDNATWTSGVSATANGGTVRSGVEAHAQGSATNQFGVRAHASPAPGNWNFPAAQYVGVSGMLQRQGGPAGPIMMAIHGHTPEVDATTYAGYFDGNVHITGAASCTAMSWTSDAGLKTDVQEITEGRATIDRLRPTTYLFEADAHPAMHLPRGLQRGFIAQEVEEVLPDLIGSVHVVGRTDEEGNMVVEGETVKTINYIGLIPMMVAAMQEQNALIEELRTELSELRQQVAGCCANPDGNRVLQQPTGAVEELPGTTPAATDGLLRIIPNPFSEPPTVHYTLERGGRAQLLVNGGDGRGLRMLHEAAMEPGSYQLLWDTNALAPGMYYVTLLLDGQPVVQKAVKVAR